MSIPKVAIVGRPNVGKSSLFNWLIGQRVSIVAPTAGVTRDRVSFILDLNDEGEEPYCIELIDTGGIGIIDEDNLSEHIEEQIRLALDTADLILLVVAAKDGIAPLDEIVAERLRKLNRPVLLVANKSDSDRDARNAEEFQRFGWDVIKVSAQQKIGRVNLTEIIRETLTISRRGLAPGIPPQTAADNDEPVMKFAVVGRRNAGKSTFINTLLNEERVIASDVPGTTRDAVDVRFEMDGKTFIAIDTPGFLRRKGVKSDLQFYSTNRAEKSIFRADVVLLFFEANSQIQQIEHQLVGFIRKAMKPVIFVVNKWDTMVGQMPTQRWGDYIRETYNDLNYAPIAFITGKTGKNLKALLNHAQMIYKQSRERVSTAVLNKLTTAALENSSPPLFHFRKPKIYYASQVSEAPPTLVFHCNMPDAFTPQYQRYMLNFLRDCDELPFPEVPVKLIFRERESNDDRNEIDKKRKT
ncbi:MAG: ribosome biogenesis GTPase Der [Planctomycetaceae bacterium]|jgi:GTP-binding protein|nr:ribosome biogenesis GTPase Der [Planctomycetaceae bacterium]